MNKEITEKTIELISLLEKEVKLLDVRELDDSNIVFDEICKLDSLKEILKKYLKD